MVTDVLSYVPGPWDPAFDDAFRRVDAAGPAPDPNAKPIPTITVAGQEVSCFGVFLPLRITHGRSSLGNQPDAPTLDMTVEGRVPWQRNDPITVDVAGVPRFAGFVDTLTTDYVGGQFTTRVTGVGWQAKAGAVKPSIPPRPVEDDVARVSAYLDVFRAAFGPWDYRIAGTSTVDLIGQDVDGGHTVLDLVHAVCESTGGLLWQARDGALVYGTANHRAGIEAVLMIDECDIVDGIQWVNDVSTLVNVVDIEYGTADPRAVHTDTDAASVTAEGPEQVRIDSLLNTADDAALLGNLILFRRAKPYWNLPGGIIVDTRDVTLAAYQRILALDVSSVILARINRDPAAPENLIEWVVEGWVEEWAPDTHGVGHTIQFSLSDRQRFGLTGIRTVGELAADFTIRTAAAMTVRDALFKEVV